MAIQSFADVATKNFFNTGKVTKVGWSNIKNVVIRKLDMLHYAHKLSDLKAPPQNKLELLKGDLAGFHSIRINNQWRIIFKWTESGPAEVKIIDYHK